MDRLRFVRGRSRRPLSLRLPQAARRAPWEALDARQLLCSTLFGDTLHDDLWATSVSSQSAEVAAAPGEVSIAAETRPDGMPILHSLPGAPTAVYLDFDGYQANTPYDTDGQ